MITGVTNLLTNVMSNLGGSGGGSAPSTPPEVGFDTLGQEWEIVPDGDKSSGGTHASSIALPDSGAVQSDYLATSTGVTSTSDIFNFVSTGWKLTLSSTGSAFADDIGKAGVEGVDWTFYTKINLVLTANIYLFQNQSGGNAGLGIRLDTDGKMTIVQRNGTSTKVITTPTGLLDDIEGVWSTLILSYDATNDIFYYKVGTNALVAVDPADFYSGGADANIGITLSMPAGSQMRVSGMLTTACADEDIATIILNHLEDFTV